MNASFLTGPVSVHPEVRAAFAAEPQSHRDPAFVHSLTRTRAHLATLVNAHSATLLVGSGTLANDAIAGQLHCRGGRGLILANGEFGERLLDHGQRWRLDFADARIAWGASFDWPELQRRVAQERPAWIWAVAHETSTGVANPIPELQALSRAVGADLCLDAVSAIGMVPVDLAGVRFASGVSGKGMAAYPGLAMVFHDGRLAAPGRLPRYLDLAAYESHDGVPYTHSSNLLAALECALFRTDWPQKFARIARQTEVLREALVQKGLSPLAPATLAAPGVLTLALGPEIDATRVAQTLATQGIRIAHQSGYLQRRNWLQIALMGEIDEAALARLPGALAAAAQCHAAPRSQFAG